MKQLLFSILIILIFSSTNLSAQSFEKDLTDWCFNTDADANSLRKNLRDLNTKNDFKVSSSNKVEIIADFYTEHFRIQRFITDTLLNKTQTKTYQIRSIEKNNRLAYYQIVEIIIITRDTTQFLSEVIIQENCGTALFSELAQKYIKAYDVKIEPAQIFNKEYQYFIPNKDNIFYCYDLSRKREILIIAVENNDTTELLNWLKSSNIALQLYAIEGIFQLTEKGISFPPNTWNWIQLVQAKEGNVRITTNCDAEYFPIKTTVQQIKKKYKKAKRKIKRAASASY